MNSTLRRPAPFAGLVALVVCLSATTSPTQAQSIDFDLVVIDGSYGGNGRPGWSAAGDIDGDGLVDVVAGGGGALNWYEAPSWTAHDVDATDNVGGNGGLILDVDGDGDNDIVAALYLSSLVWWENPGPGSVTQQWQYHTIDPATTLGFNHDLIAADVDGDGVDEFVALYVAADGVVWYDRPADPKNGNWPSTTILSLTNDPYVGLAAGDLDSDGDVDIVISNKWYENQNPQSANWTARTVFSDAVQNVAVFDVNHDRRLDVVGAQGFDSPGKLMWAAAPIEKAGSWSVTTLASNLDGPENAWVGDLQGDGRTDIMTGEMGTSNGFGDSGSNILVYRSNGIDGASFSRSELATNVGVSARLNPIDIDGDGDVDFTADGNAEDHIYLWKNQSPSRMSSAPSVAIASPSSQAQVDVGVPATINANVTVADAAVASVRFYANTFLVGQDNNGSDGWSASWTPSAPGSVELHVVAIDEDGDVAQSGVVSVTARNTSTGVAESDAIVRALSVFPSPVVTKATFQLDVARASPVRIAVYDVVGREVAMAHDGVLAVGRHNVAFEVHRLPPGIYLYRVETADSSFAGTFVIAG